MNKILLFAGTSEGRMAAQYMASCGISVTACTATEYGKTILDENESPFINVISGRLDENEIRKLISENDFCLVADATHPFAKEVTENIKRACAEENVKYIRLLRDCKKERESEFEYVNGFEEAVEYLNGVSGNILLTTGSKNLDIFTNIIDYRKRAYIRVLPTEEAIKKAIDLNYDMSHVICMQGPFSEEFNVACIKETNSSYLITKETGKNGGYDKKISACKKAGIKAVVIEAPNEEGYGFDEFKSYINKNFGQTKKKINIVGAGVGNKDYITKRAFSAVEESTFVIGANRVLECFDLSGKRKAAAINTDTIKRYIDESTDETISVVFSGDTGFYSGAAKLSDMLDENIYDKEIISGISSYSYFFSKIGKPYSDVKFLSMHGRNVNFADEIEHNKKVYMLLGGKNHVSYICRTLADCGLGDVKVYIGENLSYDNEKITLGTAKDFVDFETDMLSVIYMENENAKSRCYDFGIKDESFERGNVPMTKSEIRAISMSKLNLSETSVVYDVGAGTGSVSVECALAAYKGMVYAIEKNPEALECIERNKNKFNINNMEIIEGTAPKALENLPVPTHCFIGGSTGKTEEIVKTVLKKNPKTRFVINTITLENLFEAKKTAQSGFAKDIEIVSANISRSKAVKDLNLMMSLNPVFIISFTGNGEEI